MRDITDEEVAAWRQDQERRRAQKRLETTIAKAMAKYRPSRTSKHPSGATKQTVAARKAKNRKRRKANR